MKKLFISLFIIIFSVSSFFCEDNSENCLVSVTLYRSNRKPLSNSLVTFQSDDQKHHVDIITKENGFCLISLNQNTHYNILFEDIIYTKMFKIPAISRLEITGNMIIDGGLFANLEILISDNQGDYFPLFDEKIICESISTGKEYVNRTNEKGIVKFYVPRNQEYNISSVYEKNIISYYIKDNSGATIQGLRLRASTIPEREYHNRIAKAEVEAIAIEKQRQYDDSLKGTIPITVILFANLESKSGEQTPPVMGTLKLYDSPNKKNCLGEIVGNWNIEGLCNQGKRLCLGSVTNSDGTYSSHVLPVKLKRGDYQFYAENDLGNIQQQFSVKVPLATSLYFLLQKDSEYKITAPICIEY